MNKRWCRGLEGFQGQRQEFGKQALFERLRVQLNEDVFCASQKQRPNTFKYTFPFHFSSQQTKRKRLCHSSITDLNQLRLAYFVLQGRIRAVSLLHCKSEFSA